MCETLNPKQEAHPEAQTPLNPNCNRSNSLSVQQSSSSSLSHSSVSRPQTSSTNQSVDLDASESPPLILHQNQNQIQQSFSPLEPFQFHNFHPNQSSPFHDMYYNSNQLSQSNSAYLKDQFFPSLPTQHYQQLLGSNSTSFPPSTYRPYKERSHSLSSSIYSNSERSSYEASIPPSLSPKQTHCTVSDCFKAAFCILEPCSCTLCRDHLGSVIRSSTISGDKGTRDDLKANKATSKTFKCAGCGLESKEKQKIGRKGSLISSATEESDEKIEEGTVRNGERKLSQEEKVEEKNFSIHFFPTTNILVPLAPESPIISTATSNQYTYSPSNQQNGYQFVDAPGCNDFDIYHQQVPLIPLPPPPPFFNLYPYPLFNPYLSSLPELQPFQPIKRNVAQTSSSPISRQNRSTSLPTPSTRSSSNSRLNQSNRSRDIEAGALNSNYRFPSPPTSNNNQSSIIKEIDVDSRSSTEQFNYKLEQTSNDKLTSSSLQNNNEFTSSPASNFSPQQFLDVPLQPYRRPNYQHRCSYSSYVNASSYSLRGSYNHQQSRASHNMPSGKFSHQNQHRDHESENVAEQDQPNETEVEDLVARWPTIKVENIPFETTIEDVENWMLPGSLPSFEEVVNPVHLILHRLTGRTLPHCFIEINSKERALQIIQNQDRSQIGDRTIRVKWERRDEMMRDLFSQSEYFQTSDTTSNISLAACPLPKLAPTFLVLAQDLLEEADLKSLTECCKDLQPWKTRPIERPFLNIVSIISKFPWGDEEIEASRDAIYDCAFAAIQIASEKSERFPLYRPFVEKLGAAIERCPGFTDQQKKISSDLSKPTTAPITTPPLLNTEPQTPPATPFRDNSLRGHSYNARSWNWNARGRGRGFGDERKIFSDTSRALINNTQRNVTNQNNQNTVEVSTTSSSALATPPATPPRTRSYSHANVPTNIV